MFVGLPLPTEFKNCNNNNEFILEHFSKLDLKPHKKQNKNMKHEDVTNSIKIDKPTRTKQNTINTDIKALA